MAFETVFVAGLLLAYLAVPAEALQAFGLELVVQVFGRAYFGTRHDDGLGANECSSGWQYRQKTEWMDYSTTRVTTDGIAEEESEKRVMLR